MLFTEKWICRDDRMRFEDVLEIKNGRNQKAVENPEGQYPIYGSGGVMGYANDYICDAQTVIIGRKGSINSPIFVEEPFWNVDTAFGLSANRDMLLPRYLYYFCKKFDFERLNKTVTIPSLTKSDLLKIEIDLPDLEKQQDVVDQLVKIEHIITLREQEIESLDNLIKARFVELFGDPIHSDKFGYVRVETCVADKNDMVDGPFGSQVDTKIDYIENGEIPVIRTVNVKMMQFSPLDLKFMTREKYNAVIRSQVLPGDVILTKVGTIGNVCIFPEDYDEAVLSTTGSCRIRVDESKMNKVFFAYNLMYLKPRLLEIASAGVQPFLNMKHVKNIEVLNAPMEQQEQFVTFVHQVDKSKFMEMSFSYGKKQIYSYEQ